MTIHALLSWYEESPGWLAATIASVNQAGVTSIIALDGAYGLYEGRARSGAEQAHAITETCHALNMDLTIRRPRDKWVGNEIEKRTALFRLADSVAQADDWYWVIDADEVVTDCLTDLPARLTAAAEDVAICTLWERSDPHVNENVERLARQFEMAEIGTSPLRCLFRAIPGIHLQGNHFTYLTPDGTILWGTPESPLAPALDLTAEVRIEHKTKHRSLQRTKDRLAYYQARGRARAELTDCAECGKQATGFASADPERHEDGVAIGAVQVCDDCKPIVTERTRQQILGLGYDPDALARTGSSIAA